MESVKIYVFNTVDEAQRYIDEVNSFLGIPISLTFAKVKKHPVKNIFMCSVHVGPKIDVKDHPLLTDDSLAE